MSRIAPSTLVAVGAFAGALTAYGLSTAAQTTKSDSSTSRMSHPKKNLTVFVSGAAGQIGYALLPLIANGRVFGPSTTVKLHLLDITPALGAMAGVVMELEDGAYPNLDPDVLITDDPRVALANVDVAIFVGGFPRKPGMLRKDLIAKNTGIFSAQGQALNEVASPNVKILVVANPANTNCRILQQNAPRIPKENFTCLTRLDYNRATTQIAIKAKVGVKDVSNVTIWGNHSATQVPDAITFATVRGKSASQVINDDAWLKNEFFKTVQQRGKAIIDARKLSSAMSAANAVGDHLRTWLVTGTAKGETVPMGVVSDGSYGVEKGMVYSFPLEISEGRWRVKQNLQLSEFIKEKMKATEAELAEEFVDAKEALSSL